MIAAAKQLETQFGRLEVPFGEVNRIVLVGHDSTFQQVQPLINLPASGSGDPFGGIRALYYFPAPAPFNNQNWTFEGDTYVQVVEVTPNGAKAQALLVLQLYLI